ncbi:MAG: hypothetical protein ACK55Q_15250, partial [Dolichospermum sp.]
GIGVLGMPGATAYGGLCDTLRPLQGDTIFVSDAAGAVGGMVGQLAKALYNCKVIGSCGGAAKGKLITFCFFWPVPDIRLLRELGYLGLFFS